MPLPSSTKSGEVSAPRGLQRRLIFEEEEHTHAGTSVEFSAQPTTLVAATRGGIDTLSREASGTAAPTAYAPPVMGGGSGPIITEEWARSILQPGDEYFLYERHADRYPREVDGGYASLRPGRGTAELGLAQRRAAQRRMLEGSSRQRQVIARLERDGRSPTTRGGGGGGGYMAPLVRPSPGSASNATDANNNNNSVPRWRSSPSVMSGFHRDPSCSTPPPSISAERSRQTSIVAADDVVAKDEAMMRARHVPRLFTRPSYSANALSRSASVSGGGGAITPRWLDDAYPRRASLGEEVVEVESRTATTELPHTQASTTTTPTTPVPTTTSPPEAAGISGTTTTTTTPQTITVAPTTTQDTTTVPSTTTTTTTTTSRFDAHDLCAKMGWTMKAVVPSNAAQEPMSVEYVAAAAAPEDVEDDERNDGRATAPPRSPSPEAPPEVVAPPSEPVVVKVMQPPTSTSATRQVSPPRSHSHFQQQQQDAAAHHAVAEEDIEQHHYHHKHRGRMEVQPLDGGAANGLVGARYAVADPRALRQTHQARSIKLRTPMTKAAASVASPQQVSPTRRGTRGTPPPQPHPRPTTAATTTSSPSTAALRRSPPRPTTRKISNGRVVAKTPPTVAPPSYPPSRVVEPTQPILVSVMDERRAEDMLGGDGGLKSAASGASQQQQQQQQQQLAPTAAEAAPLQQPHTSSPTSSAAEAATTSVLANTSSISGHSPSRSTSPISTSILVNVVMPAAHGSSTNNNNNHHHHLLHNGGVVEVSSASMNEGATTPLSARATSLTKATLPPPITPLPRGTTSRSSSRSNSIFTGSKTLMAATEVKEDAAECVHGVMIKSVLPWLYGNPTTPSEVMMEEEEAEMIAAHEEELKDYVRGFIRTHPPPNTLVPTPTTSPSSSSPAAKEEEDGALRARRAGLGVIHDVKRSLRLATSPNPAPELLEEDVSDAEVPLEDGSLHLHNVGYVLSVFGAAWSLTDTNIFTGQAEVCGEEVAARSEEEAKELCAARGLEILLTVPPVEEEEVVSV